MKKDKQQSPKKKGRKPTGRQKRDFYITDAERDALACFLQDMRQGKPPIRYDVLKERADKEYSDAIPREAKGAYKPRRTISYYKAAILYDLLHIPCSEKSYKEQVQKLRDQATQERIKAQKEWTAKELNAWAERMEEEQRQRWERIKARHGIE